MSVPATYTPSDKVLKKYADLIVRFGINNREGHTVRPGSVVHFKVPEVARPLYFYLQQAILAAGHHPLGEYIPSSDNTYQFEKGFLGSANQSQLTHANPTLTEALIDTIDCTILIHAPTDLHELQLIDDKIIETRRKALKKGTLYRRQKMYAGKLNWTIATYGTDALAIESGMTLRQYWNQIIKACYLDESDPVKTWQKIDNQTHAIATQLTKLNIQSVHVQGYDVDLRLGIGTDRRWLTGGGYNIPSYEIFTSPDYREVEGWIRFNQPLYRDGKRVEDIKLTFSNGKITSVTAKKNKKLLAEIIKERGANQLGEFSLTDGRHSRITKFMADTLYDENVGGTYGNTHIAIGDSFRETYDGKPNKTWTNKDWKERGFNHSSIHIDMISTTDRTVTATLADGSETVIYKNGSFTL